MTTEAQNKGASESAVALAELRIPFSRGTEALVSRSGYALALSTWVATESLLYAWAAMVCALPLRAILMHLTRRRRQFDRGRIERSRGDFFVQLGEGAEPIAIGSAWCWHDDAGRPMLGLNAIDGRSLSGRLERPDHECASLVLSINSSNACQRFELHDYPSWTLGQRALRTFLQWPLPLLTICGGTLLWTYRFDPSKTLLGALISLVLLWSLFEPLLWGMVLRSPRLVFEREAVTVRGIFGTLRLPMEQRRYDVDGDDVVLRTQRAVVRVPFSTAAPRSSGAWWEDPKQLLARKQVFMRYLQELGYKWQMEP